MKLKDIPFTYMWSLKLLAGHPKTVLDIGCGEGELMKQIKDTNWKVTGIDIYEDSVKRAKNSGIYEKVIKGDIVKVCQQLVKAKKKFDLVFCSQVIEHVGKKQGEKILDLAEDLAQERIYFGTPRGFMDQPEVFLKGNPYQKHKSGWSIRDFTKRGYEVYGVGFYPSWSENGLARKRNTLIAKSASFLSYLFAPLVFMFPFLASGMMAIKFKK